jgi:citrate synthase
MMNGKVPDEDIAGFFDAALVMHAEHGFNASTFAAREIASTRAHMYAAVAGAVGSLSGELHGGANTRVMEMLIDIGSLDKIESYVNEQFDSGNRIMGLGHAVYKVDDPRALILAPMSKVVGERFGETKWYEMSALLEKVAKEQFKERKGRDIYTNVDFYSASLYYMMGIPMDQKFVSLCPSKIVKRRGDLSPKPCGLSSTQRAQREIGIRFGDRLSTPQSGGSR